jgi:hypothetical protein
MAALQPKRECWRFQLDWNESDRADVLTAKVLPDYAVIASSLMGLASPT